MAVQLGNAREVASLYSTLRLDDQMTSGLERARGSLRDLGAGITRMGVQLGTAVAPLALAFGGATRSAINFEEAMTNAQSITGATAEEMAMLNEQVIDLGRATGIGPQAAAEAYYQIVSGVQDVSSHMDILRESLQLAEAGAADMSTTTAGLVAAMNAYGFEAEQASFAADVYARTVQMGVGSMDEFVSSISPMAGLANTAGVSFEDLGGSMAYLTAQGVPAHQAATQLRGVLSEFITPSDELNAVFQELGYSTAGAALEQEGLAATMQILADATGGSAEELGAMFGNVRALQAVLALTDEELLETGGFLDTFTESLEGASAAAAAIQGEATANKIALMRSEFSALAIEVGGALLPALTGVLDMITPIIGSAVEWARANQPLIASVGRVVFMLAGLAAGLTATGGIISAVAIGLGVLFSPLGLIVGATIAIGVALRPLIQRMGGMNRIIKTVGQTLRTLVIPPFNLINEALQSFSAGSGTVTDNIDNIGNVFESFARGTLDLVVAALNTVLNLMSSVLPIIGEYLGQLLPVIGAYIGQFASTLIPMLMNALIQIFPHLLNFFLTLGDVLITDVIPGLITGIFNALRGIASGIFRALSMLAAEVEAWISSGQARADLMAAGSAIMGLLADGIALATVGATWLTDAIADLIVAAGVYIASGQALTDLRALGAAMLNAMADGVRLAEDFGNWINAKIIQPLVTQARDFVTSGQLQNQMRNMGNSLVGAIGIGIRLYDGFFRFILDRIITPLVNQAINYVTGGGLWDTLKGLGTGLFDAIVAGIELYAELANFILNNIIVPLAGQVGGFVESGELFNALLNLGLNIFEIISQGIVDVAIWVGANIVEPIRAALEGTVWEDVFKALVRGFRVAFNTITTIIDGVMTGINALATAISAVTTELDNLVQSVTGGGLADVLFASVGVVNPFGDGNQEGTPWTGSGAVGDVAGFHHAQEAVVPAHGMRVIPSPSGLMLEGGIGGRAIHISTVNVHGVQDAESLLDELEAVAARRAY